MGERGRVTMIGAGPGAADLITVRALARLRTADVLVYDRLVPIALLGECPPDAERICAARTPGRHRMKQSEIETLVVERARAGKHVVHLKGGDPCLFGRAGEEGLAFARAGIPFEIVPGVTSVTAACASAGIPVTHRGAAGTVIVYSARAGKGDDTRMTARPVTRVVLMALGALPEVTRELEEAGTPPGTPAAMVSAGTTGRERVVTGTLADIAARVAAADLATPALLVVGDVVKLREELRPAMTGAGIGSGDVLSGLRVVLISEDCGASHVAHVLTIRGCEVLSLPPGDGSYRCAADLAVEMMADAVVCGSGAIRDELHAWLARHVDAASSEPGSQPASRTGRPAIGLPVLVAPSAPAAIAALGAIPPRPAPRDQ